MNIPGTSNEITTQKQGNYCTQISQRDEKMFIIQTSGLNHCVMCEETCPIIFAMLLASVNSVHGCKVCSL